MALIEAYRGLDRVNFNCSLRHPLESTLRGLPSVAGLELIDGTCICD